MVFRLGSVIAITMFFFTLSWMIFPNSHAAPVEQSMNNCTWTGTWDTVWSDGSSRMYLVQIGSEVTGTYEWDEGVITGTINGSDMIGVWAESPTYEPPNDAGYFKYTISENCNSFIGEWQYGFSGTVRPWNGTRVDYGPADCVVPYFSQIDESWNQHPLRGTCGGWCIDPDTGFVTIGRCGCTLTSSAMVFATYGADTNPQQLSDCMDNVACPYAWITGSTSCSQGKVQWVDQIPFSYSALEYQLNEKRRPVILGMHRKGSPEETHWVVVVNGHGSNPANYRMHDPAFKCGAVMTLAARSSDYDFDWLSVYEGQVPCHSLTAEIPQCVARGLNPQPIITMPDSSKNESPSALIENHVFTSVVSGTVWLHTMTEITMTVEITAVSGVGTIENVMLWTDTLSNTTWQQFTPFIWLPKSDTIYVRFQDDLGNISEVYSATIHPQGPPTALISKIFLPSVNR